MKRIRKILKKDKYDKKYIEDFIEFHKRQDINGFLQKSIQDITEKELREIIGGMIAVYDLTKTIPLAEQTGNKSLMDLILMNMINNVHKNLNI